VKIFRLPEKPSALIFDMDLTLYSSQKYAQAQIDALVGKLAEAKGRPFAELEAEIAGHRRAWAASHGGAAISLSYIMEAFYGIPMEENIRWREEAYDPAPYLKRDERLRESLCRLSAALAFALVTNNAVSIARKTLAVLGVGDLFPLIIGLDTCGIAKPHRLPFQRAAELLGLGPEGCVSVGDRYDVDLAVPLELGMGAVLVDGVEDVYKLGEIFLPPSYTD
jgi:phosphoglycolate phosphatase/putative hydrolase of the HAD superfamily